MKRCTNPKCKNPLKPESEFYHNKSRSDGLSEWCKECQREYNAKRKQLRRDRYLEREYGILDIEMISKSQDDKCLICNEIKILIPDHNHTTGRFRALLCDFCNTKVGLHENYSVKEYLDKPEWKFLVVWLNSRNQRDSYLRCTYYICLDDYEMMEKTQNKVCGICFKICATGRNLCVDHDHQTLRVRGLLCVSCNQKLGRDDNHDILEYLNHFNNN